MKFSLNHVLLTFAADKTISFDEAMEMLNEHDQVIFLQTIQSIRARYQDSRKW